MGKTFIFLLVITLFTFGSCKKDEFNFLTQNHPDIPVTLTNLYGMFGTPTVYTSVTGGGAITITLEIPSTSGRTIKEITKVGAGTTATNYKAVEVSTGLYKATPIAGNGTSVTFTTSLTEFTAKTGQAVPNPPGTSTSFLNRYFFFLITLDNGEQILPVPVRVYVDK